MTRGSRLRPSLGRPVSAASARGSCTQAGDARFKGARASRKPRPLAAEPGFGELGPGFATVARAAQFAPGLEARSGKSRATFLSVTLAEDDVMFHNHLCRHLADKAVRQRRHPIVVEVEVIPGGKCGCGRRCVAFVLNPHQYVGHGEKHPMDDRERRFLPRQFRLAHARQAGGHWFDPRTAHLPDRSPASDPPKP
jgi:hypothetical protein